jgi:hypothetical protein
LVLATSLWGDLAPGHFTQIDLIAATTIANMITPTVV